VKAHVPRLLLAASLFAFLTGATPKRPLIPSLGETIQINIVNVDVIVTQKDGTPVRGLTREDFILLENGQPRDISNFAEYQEEATTDKRRDPEKTRTVVFFVERPKMARFEREKFVETLRQTARNIVRRGDSAAVVLWDGASSARVDFTDDLKVIDGLLSSVLTGRTYRGDEREELVRESEIEELERSAATIPEDQILQVAVTPIPVVVERFGDLETITEVTRMKRRVNAINAAINSMAGAEGKKVLFLATERLGEIGGGERLVEDSGTDYATQEFRARMNSGTLVDTIVNNANAAGVTIYPVYPAGRPVRLLSGGLEYLTVINEMSSLERVARETGGVEASGNTELARAIRIMEADVESYYSLAYRIETERADRKRQIAVKTKDPKLVVRARRSYIEKSDQTRMRDRLMAALVRSTNDSMFSIEAQLGNPKQQRQRRIGRVPLQVRIPIGALTVVPENGTNVGVFSVYIVSGAGGEDISALRRQTQRFEIDAAQLADAVSGHFTYAVDLVLNDKADRVAVGVVDEVSKSYAVARVTVR
jgi:VWFA-related protein